MKIKKAMSEMPMAFLEYLQDLECDKVNCTINN